MSIVKMSGTGDKRGDNDATPWRQKDGWQHDTSETRKRNKRGNKRWKRRRYEKQQNTIILRLPQGRKIILYGVHKKRAPVHKKGLLRGKIF